MWVHDTPWHMERRFTANKADIDGYLTLTLDNVDCIAIVFLNGEEIARTQNQFIRYDLDVTGKVKAGTNTLRLEFAVTKDVAKARYDAHPFPIPFTLNYLSNGLPGIHMNFVRKVACHDQSRYRTKRGILFQYFFSEFGLPLEFRYPGFQF